MARFEFQAKDRAGTVYKDRLEANDMQQAHQILRSRNWFVIRMKEEGAPDKPAAARQPAGAPQAMATARKHVRASRKQVPVKTEQMSQLLKAGMRLSEVLGVMSRRSADAAWRTVFEDLRVSVVGGRSLSESMAAYPHLFNSLYRAMVASGEASGHLVDVLERLAHYLQRREAINQRIVGALIYPSIIIVAGVGVVIFFMWVMLPQLEKMFTEMNRALPFATQLLIDSSRLLRKFGWIIPVLAIVGWKLFQNWTKDPRNRLVWDRFQLKIPLVGHLLALGEHSRFTQTLSTLLQSGVTLVDALQVSEATLGNTALKVGVHDARVQVKEGKSFNEALAGQGLFPDLMLDMLAVGERTGDLSGALQHTAQVYERDLDRAISTFTSLIEPVLIIVMAIFVGGIVFSVLMAVFDMTSAVGS
jgi:type II secretory pathway component PulF